MWLCKLSIIVKNEKKQQQKNHTHILDTVPIANFKKSELAHILWDLVLFSYRQWNLFFV